MQARFEAQFPGVLFDPARWSRPPWRSPDGYCPWLVFTAYAEAGAALRAEMELTLTRAARLGQWLVEVPNDNAVKQLHRELEQRAFPDALYPRRPPPDFTDDGD
jgi:hypothetical protein